MSGRSDYVQVPIEHLFTVGDGLTTVKEELDGVEKGVATLSGVDLVHGHRMQSAVSDFFSEWKQSRRTLLENVGNLGDVSKQIAQITSDFDDQISSSLNDFGAKLKAGGDASAGSDGSAGSASNE